MGGRLRVVKDDVYANWGRKEKGGGGMEQNETDIVGLIARRSARRPTLQGRLFLRSNEASERR